VKVFIDANVLVAVLNKEYPTFTYAARILSLADSTKFQLYTSSLCLAIAFYFSSKKSGESLAKQKIEILINKLNLAVISESAISKALKNKKVHDLEDGFQYFAAKEHGCQVIVTEDTGDFYFSEIEVLNSEALLDRYIFNPL
jgi:predicted nucleic acid-binding protein